MNLSAVKKTILLWLAIAGVLLVATFWGLTPRAIKVDTVRPVRGTLNINLSDQGTTQVREVYTISAPFAGEMLRVDWQVGEPIKAGQTLLHLRASTPTPLDARVHTQFRALEAAAYARLIAAKNQEEHAHTEWERTRALTEAGGASEQVLSASTLAWSQATAQVRVAKADWQAAQAQSQASWAPTPSNAGGRRESIVSLRSPINGTILQVLTRSSAVVPAGAPLLEVGDLGQLEITADFVSEQAARIPVGAEAIIDQWGGAPIKAQVIRIEPFGRTKVSALGVEEQRVRVVLSASNPPPSLGHGYRVEVHITVDRRHEVLQLPNPALIHRNDGWFVWLADNGRARLQPVEVGVTDGWQREIKSGVSKDSTVIIRPPVKLKEGDAVRLNSA